MKTFASSLFAGLLEHLNSSLADLADLVLLVQAGSGAEEALSYIEGQYLMKDSARHSHSVALGWAGHRAGMLQSSWAEEPGLPDIRPSASVAGAFL